MRLMSFSTTKENSNTPTERLRITELGDFYAGNADTGGYAFFDNSTLRPRYQFRQGTGTHRGFAIIETRGDANGQDIFIAKSREGNGTGIINAGDQLGKINFAGADGTNMVNGAQIFAYTQSTATVAADRMPTNLSFRTHDNDTAGVQERLRIFHDGRISISKNGWVGNDASFCLTVHTGSTSETGPVNDGIMIVSQQNNGNQNSSTGKLMFCGHAQTNGPFMYGDNAQSYGKKDLVFHTRSTANDYTTQLAETLAIRYNGDIRLKSESGNNNDTPGIVFRGGSTTQSANFAKIHSRMVSNWGGHLQFKVKNDTGSLADAYQTAMIMDQDGRVTKPLTPAFAATGSGSYFTLGNLQDFPFTNERFDIAGNYNTSNSRFTCPVDGRYLFWVTLFLYGTQPSGENRVYFKLNGSDFYNGQVVRNTNTLESIGLTIIGDLDANDYVTVGSWQNISGTQVYRGHCNFGGYLLG